MGEPQGADLGGSGLFTEAAQPPLPADPSVLPLPGGEPPPSDPADAPPPPEAQSSPPPPVKESPPPPSPSKSPPPSSPPPSSPPPSTPAASSPPPAPPAPSDPSSKSPPSGSTPPSVTPPPPAAEATPSQPNQPPASSNSPPAPPSENPGVPAVLSPPEAGIPQSPSGRPFTGAPPISHKTPPGAAHPYSPPSNDSSSGSVLVVGVVLSGVLLLLIIGICIACSKKKKKPQYYMDHGRHPKANDPYYNGPNHWNNSPMEHVVKVQMGTPGGGGGGGWGAPPMQQGNMSGEFHSGLYNNNQQASPNMGMGGFNQSQFSYQDLAAATGSFSQANLLGQGGFGYVHKGVLPDGRVVAVKSLKSGSGQGEREFQAEVDIISRVHHRHLVSLVGYCIADGQRMLVYEFVSNSTLEFHLHGKGQPVMSWEVRLRIARGSAKGLAYLHEDCHPRIIHRDIKAANILLDDNFEAMVADFGLAKLSSGNDTHVSTRVMGTFGYLAPEYASSGKLSDKSDVFSFGVMLLELITGRKPVDPNDRYMEDSLVDWARPLMGKALEDGDYSEIADPRLEGNYVSTEMARLVACAAASIRHSARRRPKMSQIVRALEGDSSLEDLNDAAGKPKISSGSGSGTSETQMYDTKMYNADMSKFRKMIMTSGEFNSSDFGATSEYGLNPSSTSGDSREYGSPGLQKPKP